jgi:hypothetical protein
MYGERNSVESWHTWILPILGATILGATFLVSLVVARLAEGSRQRSGSAEGAVAELSRNKLELFKQRRERVQQLSVSERDAIEHDLEAAITALSRRGLISDHGAVS